MTQSDVARHINSVSPNWKTSNGTEIFEDYLHFRRNKLIDNATNQAMLGLSDLCTQTMQEKAVYDEILDLIKEIKSQPTIIEE